MKKEDLRKVCKKPYLKGQRFGSLHIIKWAGMKKLGRQGSSSWLCECDCGKRKVILEHNILGGRTKSCGCLQLLKAQTSNLTHGMSGSNIYWVWSSKKMLNRLCEEWKDFEVFFNDVKDSYIEGYHLSRPNKEEPLSHTNFLWVKKQKKEKGIKTYDIDGVIYTREDAEKLLNVSRQRVQQLDAKGYLIGRILIALDNA